jgi:hypothetical protein
MNGYYVNFIRKDLRGEGTFSIVVVRVANGVAF